ncbi:hypothetical protein HDA40_001886 [Hamadaea flava]|uniref:Uncharacterized protein n=1 Tax=Hamadaea flava TaxID=1742688 RepID=A0ABV8LDQ7_9ACTN|nr:hypothetical protein [Hamadaea flava]MCP2323379.1 hypothetical protein [Hamadaea flava]
MGDFDDLTQPSSLLVPPPDKDDVLAFGGQPFADPGSLLDWLSPTHIVNQFVEQVTGYDVIGNAMMTFGGDWEFVWRAAGAFDTLGNTLAAIAQNIGSGNFTLDHHWGGNAADGAFAYFYALGVAAQDQHIPLQDMAKQYRIAAESTWRLGNVLNGVLEDIVDAAMVALVAASAGTAAIETGVGFVAGWAVAAYEAMKITRLVGEAKKIIDIAIDVMNGILGVIGTLKVHLSNFAKHPLPLSSYSSPATA